MSKDQARFDVIAQLPALRRYGLVLTRNPVDAEDLVHEALLRAYEKRASFRSDQLLGPWLLSILHNCYVDGLRRKRTEQATLALVSRLSDGTQEAPQEHNVRLAQLRQRLLALPEEQRAALHLVAIEGLSYQEAASTLGLPVGTLMSRLGRARAALRSIEAGDQSSTASASASASPVFKIVGGTDDPSH